MKFGWKSWPTILLILLLVCSVGLNVYAWMQYRMFVVLQEMSVFMNAEFQTDKYHRLRELISDGKFQETRDLLDAMHQIEMTKVETLNFRSMTSDEDDARVERFVTEKEEAWSRESQPDQTERRQQ